MAKPKREGFGDEKDNNSEFFLDEYFNTNKIPIVGVLIGLILIGAGIFIYKRGIFESSEKVEIINTDSTKADTESKQLIVEISGAIEKPGVYKLDNGSRVEDLLIAAGGISLAADRNWVEKYINRASRLTDGQKLYIVKSGEIVNQQLISPSARNSTGIKVDHGGVLGQQTEGININTATLSELDTLPGIGQVYGQSIIDHRPYSTVSELLDKGALKQNVYDKIKDLVTVY